MPSCRRWLVVELVSSPIDRLRVMDAVRDPAHGGEAFFFGAVRDLNQGRRVLAVSYDAHEKLCLRRFEEILAGVRAKYPVKLALVHRVGRLLVGDVSVAIGASSRHRDEAFRACREVIEAVKHGAPIWKLEHYEDGDSGWVEGHSLCGHDPV